MIRKSISFNALILFLVLILILEQLNYLNFISNSKRHPSKQAINHNKKVKHIETPHKENLCPACNFTPLYPPTSTKRDVVLAAALNSIDRAEIFLRTLRMTGSRCRVILFLDSKQSIEPHFLRFFKSCEIEPVYVDNQNNKILIEGSKMTRYYYYHQWLSKHIDEVDRVLHSDTFDVFFQSDPFQDTLLPLSEDNEDQTILQKFTYDNIAMTVNIKQHGSLYYSKEKSPLFGSKNLLYVSIEPVSLSSSVYTGIWFSKCYGSLMSKYYLYPVSCSGVTMGYSRVFLTYLNILFEKSNWKNCFGDSLDQAHHNYIFYHKDVQNEGIVIKGLDCNSEFLTMHFCCRYANCHLDNKTNIFYGNNSLKAPIIVHQYNRLDILVNRNKFFCPGNAKNLFDNENVNVGNSSNSSVNDEFVKVEKLPPFDFPIPDKLS